jgi:hypothetical protein
MAIVKFYYKCYYVLFLYYTKYKREPSSFRAIGTLSVSLWFLAFSLLAISGVLDHISLRLPRSSLLREKIWVLLFVLIPSLLLSQFLMRYMVFKIAKASKETGKSEVFEFTPTKRDRIVCWGFCLFSFSSIFIVVGVRVLLGYYD